MDLSIIIVNYNTCDLLRDCLRSVLASQVELSYEILVVDNKSPDDSVAMVRSEYPQAQLTESPINGGYAHANHLGLRAASGAHLLLLNPDPVLPPRAMRAISDFPPCPSHV